MKLGGAELLVILLVAFFVLGPDRTVRYARKTGKWLRVLKMYISSMTEDLKETVVEPLEELQEPLQEIWKPAGQLAKELGDSVDGVSEAVQAASQPAARRVRRKPAPGPDRSGIPPGRRAAARTAWKWRNLWTIFHKSLFPVSPRTL